jgi:hypothetical protein
MLSSSLKRSKFDAGNRIIPRGQRDAPWESSNVVPVWQSAASGFEPREERTILDWQAGTDVVDGIGMSYFDCYQTAWINFAIVSFAATAGSEPTSLTWK